nr:MAG TPA: hypothetical protein [Caudoviricetes sp.]
MSHCQYSSNLVKSPKFLFQCGKFCEKFDASASMPTVSPAGVVKPLMAVEKIPVTTLVLASKKM